MAERLEGFDFGTRGRATYPWSVWLDGSVWRLDKKDMGGATAAAFQSQIHAKAKAKGFKARTSRDGECLVVQAYKEEE